MHTAVTVLTEKDRVAIRGRLQAALTGAGYNRYAVRRSTPDSRLLYNRCGTACYSIVNRPKTDTATPRMVHIVS
jgi:hypothetical protein